MDSSRASERFYFEHPDWFAVDAAGPALPRRGLRRAGAVLHRLHQRPLLPRVPPPGAAGALRALPAGGLLGQLVVRPLPRAHLLLPQLPRRVRRALRRAGPAQGQGLGRRHLPGLGGVVLRPAHEPVGAEQRGDPPLRRAGLRVVRDEQRQPHHPVPLLPGLAGHASSRVRIVFLDHQGRSQTGAHLAERRAGQAHPLPHGRRRAHAGVDGDVQQHRQTTGSPPSPSPRCACGSPRPWRAASAPGGTTSAPTTRTGACSAPRPPCSSGTPRTSATSATGATWPPWPCSTGSATTTSSGGTRPRSAATPRPGGWARRWCAGASPTPCSTPTSWGRWTSAATAPSCCPTSAPSPRRTARPCAPTSPAAAGLRRHRRDVPLRRMGRPAPGLRAGRRLRRPRHGPDALAPARPARAQTPGAASRATSASPTRRASGPSPCAPAPRGRTRPAGTRRRTSPSAATWCSPAPWGRASAWR